MATTTAPEVEISDDSDDLATKVASQSLEVLALAQERHGRAAIALTAGSIMEAVWRKWADLAAENEPALDWSRVDVFWGDERFVPADSADRNDGPANTILFDQAPFSAARLYPMPTSDGTFGADLDAAAHFYAGQLAEARRPDDVGDIPNFDVVLLGVGPDGHCASLFPGHPGVFIESETVIAVRNSPKPPPERISLSFNGLNIARQIWVVASGDGKADAVSRALAGASREQVPSAGARGTERTVWLIDRAAASLIENHPGA